MPPKSASSTWSDKTHTDLLLAMNKILKPSVDQWKLILAEIEEQGHHFTHNAVKKHITLLDKRRSGQDSGTASKRQAADSASDGEAESKAASPKKSRKPAAKRAKGESSKKVPEDE